MSNKKLIALNGSIELLLEFLFVAYIPQIIANLQGIQSSTFPTTICSGFLPDLGYLLDKRT